MIFTPNSLYNKALEIAPSSIAAITRTFKKAATINPELLARLTTAIVKKESTFNSDAKNRNSTARGLMQLVICTQRQVEEWCKLPFAPAHVSTCGTAKGCNDKYCGKEPPKTTPENDTIYQPEYNLLIGMAYLAYQLQRYDYDTHKALYAFNQGGYRPANIVPAGVTYANAVQNNIQSLAAAFAPTSGTGGMAVFKSDEFCSLRPAWT